MLPLQRLSPRLMDLVRPGLSHRETTEWHMRIARDMIVWLLLHATLIVLGYILEERGQANNNNNNNQQYNDKTSWWIRFRYRMLPDYWSGQYTEGFVNFMGWMALFALAGLWLTSRPWVQVYSHEVFLSCHWIFGMLFLFFCNLHDYNTLMFVFPAVVVLLADYLQRETQQIMFMKGKSLKVPRTTSIPIRSPISKPNCSNEKDGGIFLEHDLDRTVGDIIVQQNGLIIALSIPIPPAWKHQLLYPGSFVYLKTGVGRMTMKESHPFSISSVNDHQMTIHVKTVTGGWTNALGEWLSHTLQENNCSIEMKMEGPYGMDLDRAIAEYGSMYFCSWRCWYHWHLACISNKTTRYMYSHLVDTV